MDDKRPVSSESADPASQAVNDRPGAAPHAASQAEDPIDYDLLESLTGKSFAATEPAFDWGHLFAKYSLVGLLLFILVFVGLCINNQRTFTLRLQYDGTLEISKGNFFPAGSTPQRSLRIGLEPGWHNLLGDDKLARQLEIGYRIEGSGNLQLFFYDLLERLGEVESRGNNEESLERAAYYYSEVYRQTRSPDIKRKLGMIHLRTADLRGKQGRIAEAETSLRMARQYGFSERAASMRESFPPTPTPAPTGTAQPE